MMTAALEAVLAVFEVEVVVLKMLQDSNPLLVDARHAAERCK
jgi:hypothetical protein